VYKEDEQLQTNKIRVAEKYKEPNVHLKKIRSPPLVLIMWQLFNPLTLSF
jgi:hypothetical protein